MAGNHRGPPHPRGESRRSTPWTRFPAPTDSSWHCCIEPECAGEAQQSGGSPSWQGAKKGRTTRPCLRSVVFSSEVEAVARGDRSMQQCPSPLAPSSRSRRLRSGSVPGRSAGGGPIQTSHARRADHRLEPEPPGTGFGRGGICAGSKERGRVPAHSRMPIASAGLDRSTYLAGSIIAVIPSRRHPGRAARRRPAAAHRASGCR